MGNAAIESALTQSPNFETPVPGPSSRISRPSNTSRAAEAQTSLPLGQATVRNALCQAFPSIGSRGGSTNIGSNVKGKRTSTTLPYAFAKKKGKKSQQQRIVHKEVILLTNPDIETVPMHRTHTLLENQGLVLHKFPIDTDWGEGELFMEVRRAFPVLFSKVADIKFVNPNPQGGGGVFSTPLEVFLAVFFKDINYVPKTYLTFTNYLFATF